VDRGSRRGRGKGRNRRGRERGDERETKRNESHVERVECKAKTCNYACPGVCQIQREEVPVVGGDISFITVPIT